MMEPLVGRRGELAGLRELLDEVESGVGRVVAVSGEAGVGKSRLAEECLSSAAERGFLVLRGGGCSYQRELSYATIVETLRPLIRADPRGLISGFTDLGQLFEGLAIPEPPRLGDAGLERVRLFEAIAQLVERAAGRQPLAVLIEDLHWVDASSLDVLHYLARVVCQFRCLLAGDLSTGRGGGRIAVDVWVLARGWTIGRDASGATGAGGYCRIGG
jgi:predicted ATPase